MIQESPMMSESNRVSETQRLGNTEEVSLNHLAGILPVIEGLRPNRIHQGGDAGTCRVPLAGLDALAAANILVALMESLATWIDAKPHRFHLILLAHTAVVGAILATTARF
jgi:hypothetical protein